MSVNRTEQKKNGFIGFLVLQQLIITANCEIAIITSSKGLALITKKVMVTPDEHH